MLSVFSRWRSAGVPLCLIVLWSPLAVFAQSDNPEDLHAGRILVATPDYVDRVYGESVILLTRYGPDGAAGIMLNRQTQLPVSKALPGLELSSALYLGGPVSEDDVLVIVQSAVKPPKAIRVLGDLFVISDKPLLAKTLTQPPGQFHAYLGYCEWRAGQLESEVHDGAWYIFAGRRDQVFDEQPESLWQRLISQIKQQFAGLISRH
jgi:putative transcriptional regulator